MEQRYEVRCITSRHHYAPVVKTVLHNVSLEDAQDYITKKQRDNAAPSHDRRIKSRTWRTFLLENAEA